MSVLFLDRGSTSFLADLIRRVGKWNDNIMSRIYLSSLPREYVRKVAGHPNEGHYFVDRAQIQPPCPTPRPNGKCYYGRTRRELT